MNIFHKTQKKETRKLPMTGKVKKGFRYYCAAVLSVTAVFAMSTTAFAASDPLSGDYGLQLRRLYDFFRYLFHSQLYQRKSKIQTYAGMCRD